MRVGRTIALSLFLLCGFGALALAQSEDSAPALVPIEGQASDADGVPLEGSHPVSVKLFRVETGGTAIFSETQRSVPFDHGAFSAYVGDVSALDLDVIGRGGALWLELAIDGEVIKPRFRFGSVPFAAFAKQSAEASLLEGKRASEFAATEHRHPWSDLTAVPAGFVDGTDDDTLGGLSCPTGSFVKKVAGGWDCAPISAADITTGLLPEESFSAYDDLDSEGRLDGNAADDLLRRGFADGRYLPSTFVSTSYNVSAVSTASAAVTQVATSPAPHFCALTRVDVSSGGACEVTGQPSSYTLTAYAPSGTKTTSCRMTCF